MHNNRALSPAHLNGMQLSLMLEVPPVLFLLWQDKMFAVKRVYSAVTTQHCQSSTLLQVLLYMVLSCSFIIPSAYPSQQPPAPLSWLHGGNLSLSAKDFSTRLNNQISSAAKNPYFFHLCLLTIIMVLIIYVVAFAVKNKSNVFMFSLTRLFVRTVFRIIEHRTQ